MKKILTAVLALTLLLALAAPALAVSDARAVLETMERFIADGGMAEQVDELEVEYVIEDGLYWHFFIDFDGDGVPELLRCYQRDAQQGSMDVFSARPGGDGYELTKVASFVDDGYHVLFGGTDRLHWFGRFSDGTYGIRCSMPVWVFDKETGSECVSESFLYYAYRDGAFCETEENGFQELSIDDDPYAYYAPAPAVVLSAQNLMVDGVSKAVEKYNIDGSNFFKLRDLAYLLNGTAAQFAVGWDEASQTVSITTGEAYVLNGNEMIVGADKSDTAQVSAQTILINGVERSDLSVFNIGGNNFFKLRDLGAALGFSVDYDAATNTAMIFSSI